MIDFSQKRICVTGGAGFLGGHLIDELRARGSDDVFIPRSSHYDLTTEDGTKRLFEDAKPQVLFHLAAVVGGIGANQENPGRFFYANAIMGIHLLEQARVHGIEKVVVIGTICAYPKFAPVPFREEDLWNGYPEETNAPYGVAKKALLVMCQAYRTQYGLNAIYLLPVNLYGPRDNFDLQSSHVIPALIRKFVAARESGASEVVCWGDGSPTREFFYVTDAARGIADAAQSFNGHEPVNLGSGEEISIRKLSELIAAEVGFTGNIVWDTAKPNGQPRRQLDISRARESFGFTAQVSLRDGLKATIRWWEEFGQRR